MVPQTYVDLTDEKDVKNLQRTLDLLDEDDDVTDVWTTGTNDFQIYDLMYNN